MLKSSIAPRDNGGHDCDCGRGISLSLMVPRLSPAHRGLFVCAKLDPMLKLTLRYIEGHFIVTGPDIPPMQFKSRAEAQGLVQGELSRLAYPRGWRRGAEGTIGSTKAETKNQPANRELTRTGDTSPAEPLSPAAVFYRLVGWRKWRVRRSSRHIRDSGQRRCGAPVYRVAPSLVCSRYSKSHRRNRARKR